MAKEDPTRKIPIGVIVGPTGVGKTHFAIQIALKHNAEIVSADSMQVYRYLNIGTAKPSSEQQALIPHHLIDVVDPDERFDLAKFISLATAAIKDIHSRGKYPLVVGGTGLYVKGLLEGIFEVESTNLAIRESLEEEAKMTGVASLYDHLGSVDPIAAKKIMPNDRVRIIRALEVFLVTGKTISALQQESKASETPFDHKVVRLELDREKLYERIEKRVDRMFELGFVDEVKGILDKGFQPDLHSLRALGYQQVIQHINNAKTLDEAKAETKKRTRNYAKRQLTWLRPMNYIHQIDTTHLSEQRIIEMIEKIIF